MDFDNMSEEEIEKIIKSLDTISNLFSEGPDVKEQLLVTETELYTNELMFETITKISEKWSEALEEIKTPLSKTLIKGVLVKNFRSLQEFENLKKANLKQIEEYKKML